MTFKPKSPPVSSPFLPKEEISVSGRGRGGAPRHDARPRLQPPKASSPLAGRPKHAESTSVATFLLAPQLTFDLPCHFLRVAWGRMLFREFVCSEGATEAALVPRRALGDSPKAW